MTTEILEMYIGVFVEVYEYNISYKKYILFRDV